MPKLEVLSERCKGCGLCVQVCPKSCLELGREINRQGYGYVQWDKDGKCIGCAFCAEICPDMAIRVWREAKPKKKKGGK